MRQTGTLCQVAGGLAFAVALLLVNDLVTHTPMDQVGSKSDACWGNVSHMIGISLRVWAHDHHGQYPFNVSTNEGGTLELCARGSDGFDRNAWRHLQALSNEVVDPAVLVCPKDLKHKPAKNFQSLGSENVTYRLRTGPNLNATNKTDVLLVCPLDGNCIYGDCHWEDKAPSAPERWRYTTTLRQGVGQILVSLGAAAILFGLGSILKRSVVRTQSPPRPAGNSKGQLMSRHCVGGVCRFVGAGVAIAGLVPGAVLLNPWRKADKLSQIPEIYFHASLLRSAAIAAAGFVAAYVLLRVGSHLKSKD